MGYTQTNVIVPDAHGDWLNQRDDSYAKFMRIDGKQTRELSIFRNHSRGIATGRDAWSYNTSKRVLQKNIQKSIDYFNDCVNQSLVSEYFIPHKDDVKIKWNEMQDAAFRKKEFTTNFDAKKNP